MEELYYYTGFSIIWLVITMTSAIAIVFILYYIRKYTPFYIKNWFDFYILRCKVSTELLIDAYASKNWQHQNKWIIKYRLRNIKNT